MPEIFYVDDSRDDLFYLEYIRRKQEIDVELCCFGTANAAAAALAQRLRDGGPLPAILIADLYMPLESGLKLIETLRVDDRFSAMKRGVCSGSDAAEDRDRSLAAGAHFYFEKPLDLAALLGNL